MFQLFVPHQSTLNSDESLSCQCLFTCIYQKSPTAHPIFHNHNEKQQGGKKPYPLMTYFGWLACKKNIHVQDYELNMFKLF